MVSGPRRIPSPIIDVGPVDTDAGSDRSLDKYHLDSYSKPERMQKDSPQTALNCSSSGGLICEWPLYPAVTLDERNRVLRLQPLTLILAHPRQRL